MLQTQADRPAPTDSDSPPSPEWRFFDMGPGFTATFGPVHFRETDDDHLLLGFRCGPRHVNPAGFCHGGALAAFADYAALGAQYRIGFDRIVVPTVTLSIDFLRTVRQGDWLEGRTEVTMLTGKMCFTSFVVRVEGEPVLSSRGIFKLSRAPEIMSLPFYADCRALWPRAAARKDRP